MRVSVVGLGKIGLPLAVQYAERGLDVVGLDVSPRVVDLVNLGREPFPGEAELEAKLGAVVAEGKLRATTSYAGAITGSDVVVVVVPLVVDAESQPDFSIMDAATRDIASNLTPGVLVSYETTLPVGTTRGRLTPLLEAGSGLVAGRDFHVVFSPERVLTGRVFADLRKYPKLIGAQSTEGADRAREFYEAALSFDDRPDLERPNGVWDLGSPEAAELAKLAETTYRDVNIALANQFALFADRNGIDVFHVIEASNSQPYSHIHRPGISVGGHCIPVYPRLYLSTDPDAELIRSARALNASVPGRLVAEAGALLGSLEGLTAVVLGAAYRGGVKEVAFSGVFPTVDALTTAGATVRVHDPLYDDDELAAMGFAAHEIGTPADLVIVHTDHSEYRELHATAFPGVRLVLDGRNITEAANWLGVPRLVFGAGDAPREVAG